MSKLEKQTAVLMPPLPVDTGEIEVRRNPDGTMDEVCGYGFVHIEQMSATHWWLRIDGKKDAVVVSFHSRATIKENTEREPL